MTGAQVGFLAADNSGTTLEDFEVTTDADGHFSGQVSESFLKLAVEPPEGMDLWPEELTDINVSEDLTVRLTLSQAVTVSGRVALPENPAGDPRIQLWSLTKDRQYETLSQDEIFEIEVPADRYSIEAVYGACLGQLGNHCVRVNVDASRGDVEGITIAWSEQLQPALLVDPPRAALISVSDPDESGIAVVAGDPGAAAGLSTIAIVNLQTGQRSLTTSDADGSFAGTMFAPPGSHILVKHDPTGRYLVPGDLQISFEFPPGTSLYVPPSPSAAGIPLAATSIADGGPGLLNADPQEVKALGIRDPGQLWVSGTINSRQWNPGESISLNGKAVLYSKNLVTKPDLSAVTVTGKIYLERLFDGQGKQVQNRREFMSHIMTPTGLPLESSGDFSFVLRPLGSWEADSLEWVDEGRVEGNWHLDLPVPEDVPAGIYRVYFDLRGEGVPNENRHFGVFPALARTGEKPGSLVVQVGSPQPPRLTWALGSNEFSNGSRGSVAVQDRGRFQIASNVIINTNEFILPMQDPRTGESVKCRLEPFVPMVSSAHARIPLPPRIPFKFPSGSLQVRVIKPDGGVDRLESTPFAQSMSRSPVSPGGHPISGFSNHVTDFYQLTTLDPRFEYSFTQYGNHQVVMTGTIEDLWGTVYEGGGTYEVVVGETLDLESAVVAGTPFEVGDVFSPGVAIRPAVAADVEVRFKLLIHSDPTASVERVIRGRANRFGYFSPSHEPIVLTGPGEYRVDITARYEDELGVSWMGAVSWGSVVETPDSPLVTHGRRGFDGNNPNKQQWLRVREVPTGGNHLQFPYQTGDIMWMEEVGGGASDFPKVSIQDTEGSFAQRVLDRAPTSEGWEFPWDIEDRIAIQEIPLFSSTSRGNSVAPVAQGDVDEWGYFYAFVERPGVHVREFVSGDESGFGYWRFRDNYQFQLGSGENGDLPNDFKFQFGGAVYRVPEDNFFYYGAYASLFVLLPEGDEIGGRIFPPFQGNAGGPSGGPIMTLKGKEIDIFFHPILMKPGSILVVGDVASFVGHIAPTLPSKVEIKVTTPGGQVREVTGQANKIGYFYDPSTDFEVKEPGPHRVQVKVWHNGQTSAGPVQEPFPIGDVLGSNEGEFFLYVVEKDARDLGVDVPRASFVQPALGPIQIPLLPGEEPPDALEVHFTTVMPGFLLEEGTMSASPSTGLVYSYDAPGLHQDFPNLDLQDRDNRTGADTIVMSFLLSSDKGGRRVYQARQLVLHGEELLALPHSLAPTINLVSPTDASAGTRIQITGTRFLGGDLAVLFNGVSGIDIVVVDGSTILVTVPELPSAGPVTITVATDEGSVRLTDGLVVEKAAFGLANLLFTQFANGEIRAFAAADWEAQQGSIPNRTRIILINNSDEADSGVLRFRDAAGNPIQVQIDGVAADTVSYSLLPWSTTEVETDGTGDLQTGTIEVISGRGEESSLEGTEAFEILGNFVSVASSPRRSSQQLYVSVTETENTGVALLNPDQQNAVTLDAALLDSHNEEKAEKEIVLQGGQQLVAFVDQADLLPTSSRLNQEIFKVA